MIRARSLVHGLAALSLVFVLATQTAPVLAGPKLWRPDGSWISLSGTVVSVEDQRFVLGYGKGEVTVEMDDWDAYNEAAPITVGDNIRVYGEVDADSNERRTIEAGAVYSENLKTYFYSDDLDEEGAPPPYSVPMTTGSGWASVAGAVKAIDGREMIVDTPGFRDVRVDTSDMAYDPFSGEGARPVRVGDKVSVLGRVDQGDFFDRRELDAESVITLVRLPARLGQAEQTAR